MTTGAPELCHDCMLWHPLPKCGHDADAACLGCNKPRGFRFIADNGQPSTPAWRCWFCVTGAARPTEVLA